MRSKMKTIIPTVVILLIIFSVAFISEDAKSVSDAKMVDKKFAVCQQKICVDNGADGVIVTVRLVRNWTVVGTCTTDATGCCPYLMELTQGSEYNAQGDCGTTPSGINFTACTNVVYVPCN